jgi:hypothetical protein
VTENAKGVVSATAGDYTDLSTSDKVIVVLNGSTVAYIVNVTDAAKTPTWLTNDWVNIINEQSNASTTTTLSIDAVTVNGVAAKDGKVSLTYSEANDKTVEDLVVTTSVTGATVSAVVSNSTNSTASVLSNIGTDKTGIYTDGDVITITATDGTNTVYSTIAVEVAAAGTDATIKSLTIKGTAVKTIDALSNTTSGTVSISEAITVTADNNNDDSIKQIEVTLNDANATWAITTPGTVTFDQTNTGSGKDGVASVLQTGNSTNDAVITVTAEDGSTGVYTIGNLTVEDYTLTLAVNANNATVSGAKAGKISSNKDVTFTVEGVTGYAVDTVTYSLDQGTTPVTLTAGADGTYTIPADVVKTATTANGVQIDVTVKALPVVDNKSAKTVYVNDVAVAGSAKSDAYEIGSTVTVRVLAADGLAVTSDGTDKVVASFPDSTWIVYTVTDATAGISVN